MQNQHKITQTLVANKWRNLYAALMDEGRKRVILIAAAILAARRLAQLPNAGRVPATICAIQDAVRYAHQIMIEIDRMWPSK